MAADSPATAHVRLAPGATAHTKALATKYAPEVAAAQTVCGSGYGFANAYALPDNSERFGTLFIYSIGRDSGPSAPVCAIFDNNTTSAKWMKLEICNNRVPATCHTDANYYSQYAGPVYMNPNDCGTITTLMRWSANDDGDIINAVRPSASCN
ncbi:hypothetical protein ACWGCW_35090 [Streptomyces sp. NPDC054933]